MIHKTLVFPPGNVAGSRASSSMPIHIFYSSFLLLSILQVFAEILPATFTSMNDCWDSNITIVERCYCYCCHSVQHSPICSPKLDFTFIRSRTSNKHRSIASLPSTAAVTSSSNRGPKNPEAQLGKYTNEMPQRKIVCDMLSYPYPIPGPYAYKCENLMALLYSGPTMIAEHVARRHALLIVSFVNRRKCNREIARAINPDQYEVGAVP
jgi:hypothetical protein